MNARPIISSTKLVYSNDMFNIYISTNTKHESLLGVRKPAYVYLKGEFDLVN
jgi:hypothetical protein